MIKKLFTEQQHAPTAWERLAAVITWLTVSIPLLAFIVGMLEFLLLRKRRTFIANHGLNAALCATVIMCVFNGILLFMMHILNSSDAFEYLQRAFYSIVQSPFSIGYYWRVFTPLMRIMLSILLGIIPAILLVSIAGALSALFGHRQSHPRVDRETSLPAAAQ